MKDAAYLAENLRISQDHNAVLRPRERNVQPPRVVEETNSLVLVAPDAAEDDVVLLPPLERVDAGNLDLLLQVLFQGPVELHVVHDVRSLSLVRGDDPDLARHDARLEELGDDLLDVRRLGSGERRQRGRTRT